MFNIVLVGECKKYSFNYNKNLVTSSPKDAIVYAICSMNKSNKEYVNHNVKCVEENEVLDWFNKGYLWGSVFNTDTGKYHYYVFNVRIDNF